MRFSQIEPYIVVAKMKKKVYYSEHMGLIHSLDELGAIVKCFNYSAMDVVCSSLLGLMNNLGTSPSTGHLSIVKKFFCWKLDERRREKFQDWNFNKVLSQVSDYISGW